MHSPKNDTQEAQDVYSLIMNSSTLAYVRPVITENGKSYAVCSADGTQLALFATEEAAYFTAKQHDLEPVLIH